MFGVRLISVWRDNLVDPSLQQDQPMPFILDAYGTLVDVEKEAAKNKMINTDYKSS